MSYKIDLGDVSFEMLCSAEFGSSYRRLEGS